MGVNTLKAAPCGSVKTALDHPTRDRFRSVAGFRDRVAIVTGAGAPGGIGAAVARALVAEGGRVVLGATSERVHQRAAELGDAAVGVIADLTVDGAADSLVRAALDRWDRGDRGWCLRRHGHG
jgi:NAD(P)-dependent dehydrogenase (short-subunit alcohol dehydrogenase family)